MERQPRSVFDEVAELYERARPGYPAALVDDVVAFADLAPGARLLELGGGTGQATRPFAERGFAIVCLEPGSRLRKRARAALARFPQVEVRPETFEAWPLEPEAFDLVFAAQSFHWLDPEVRFAKAAAALRDGGTLAVFGNAPLANDAPVRKAVERVYAERARTLLARTAWAGGRPGLALQQAFREAPGFGPLEMREHPWERVYDAAAYAELLTTHSDHRMLPPEELAALLRGVTEAIRTHGDRVPILYSARIWMARKCAAP